jgi:hypothetical protein
VFSALRVKKVTTPCVVAFEPGLPRQVVVSVALGMGR